jgi:hypothetical protein
MTGLFSVPLARDLPKRPIAMWWTDGGRPIAFSTYGTQDWWPSGPAIYVFGKYIGSQWVALYIGEAENLRARLTNHEKWSAAVALGMNGVHVHHHIGTEAQRKADEAALIRAYRPTLNIQHNAGLAGLGAWLTKPPLR